MVQKHDRPLTAAGIPCFQSAEEEATFWETHSPLDYPEYWNQGVFHPDLGDIPLPFPITECGPAT